ncbi:MAG: biotin/lipoyl-containing protein, partial [Novosphingobium sp.]
GWAIENRVYAEDPYRGFLPSTGRLTRYRPPVPSNSTRQPVLDTGQGFSSADVAEGSQAPHQVRGDDVLLSELRGVDGIRVDDGVMEGGEVSMFYDPMIAKLVTWGETRDEAADKQIAALDAFEIEGLGHNIDFVSAIMQHPRFRSGELTTGFIAEEYPDGFHGAAASVETLRHLAAIAGFVATARADRARQVDQQLNGELEPPYDWSITLGGQTFAVSLEADVLVNGQPIEIALEYTPGDRMVEAEITRPAHPEPVEGSSFASSEAEGKVSPSTSSGKSVVRYGVKIEPTRTGLKMTTRGAIHQVQILPARIAHLTSHMIEKVPPDLSRFLICPMPGLLVSLSVAVGDKVEAGQPLAVVEAMKMENILRAEKSATVKAVNAAQGESLAVDAIILELE